MKKVLFFILILSHILFADALPSKMELSVKSVSSNSLELSSNVPKGMSGIVIHNYGNGLFAITHTARSLGGAKASFQKRGLITHKKIPSIQTEVTVGDKVIFGNFYNNVLLIAPNQTAYKQITSKFNRTWIHPDIFALAFMQKGEGSLTMETLKSFAKQHQVGLVLVVTQDKLLVIDPLSKSIIGSTRLKTNPNTAMSPFYARFKLMDTSLFGVSSQDYAPYFQLVAGLSSNDR